MDKKTLILSEPITRSYLFDAYPLSILAANGDAYLPWLLSNYIQIDCFADISAEEMFLVFHGPLGIHSPYLKTQKILHSSLIHLDINIHTYIKKHIDDDYYMYFQIDDYHNPYSSSYEQNHHIHDLMIFGYDDSIKKYNIVGYNEQFIYTENLLEYDLFEKAFYHNDVDKNQYPWTDQILALKYNENGSYNFNINLVRFLLTEYLASKNSMELLNRFENPSTQKIYGIGVFDKLQEYISNMKIKNSLKHTDKKQLDMRVFRIIREWTAIMMERLKFINKNITDVSDVIRECEIIKQHSDACFFSSMKYNLTFSNSLLDSISNYLNTIKELQIRNINNLLELL